MLLYIRLCFCIMFKSAMPTLVFLVLWCNCSIQTERRNQRFRQSESGLCQGHVEFQTSHFDPFGDAIGRLCEVVRSFFISKYLKHIFFQILNSSDFANPRWDKEDDRVAATDLGQVVGIKVAEGCLRVQFPAGRWKFPPEELLPCRIQPGHLWLKSSNMCFLMSGSFVDFGFIGNPA